MSPQVLQISHHRQLIIHFVALNVPFCFVYLFFFFKQEVLGSKQVGVVKPFVWTTVVYLYML